MWFQNGETYTVSVKADYGSGTDTQTIGYVSESATHVTIISLLSR